MGTSAFKNIGYISLLLVFISSSSFYIIRSVVSKNILTTQFKLLAISLPFICLYFIGTIENNAGIITFIQFIMLFLLMLMISSLYLDKYHFKVMGICTAIFVSSQFYIWLIQGFPQFYKSIFGLSNLVGAYMMYSIILFTLVKGNGKIKYIYYLFIGMSLAILWGTNTRSVIIALIVFGCVVSFWDLITKNKNIYITFFIVVLTGTISFFYFYLRLPEMSFFPKLEGFMLQTFNKSLMSGREDIWLIMFDLFYQKPFLGYGTGIQNYQISILDKSGHNLYLQMLVQNGLLGLISFLIIMFSIWLIFWKARKDYYVKVVAASFISTLVYQSFEITFTQNALSIGVIQWAIIGIGISRCIYYQKTQTYRCE